MKKSKFGLASLLVAISLVAAGCGGNKTSSTSVDSTSLPTSTAVDSTSVSTPAGEVTIAGAKAAKPASGATTARYTTRGVVTAKFNNRRFFISDASEAIYVYQPSATAGSNDLPNIEVGDYVKVTGKVINYNGLAEISETTGEAAELIEVEVLADTPPTPLAVEVITEDKFNATDLAGKDSRLVTINGLTFVSGTPSASSSSDLKFATPNGTNVTLRADKEIADMDKVIEKIDSIGAGDTIDIVNVNLGWFNDPQLALTSADQIVIHKAVLPETMVIEGDDEVELGNAISLVAKMNIEDVFLKVDASWTSSNETAAIVTSDGLVVAKTVGTTTITATYEGVSQTKAITVVAEIAGKVDTTVYESDLESWEGSRNSYQKAKFTLDGLDWTPDAVNGFLFSQKLDSSSGSPDEGDLLAYNAATNGLTVGRMKKDATLELSEYFSQISKFELDVKQYKASATHKTAQITISYQVYGTDTWTDATLDSNVVNSESAVVWSHVTATINKAAVKIRISTTGGTVNFDNFEIISKVASDK